ncbi:MAG: hypothetical protein H7141_00070 [Burkholderiales bacterium]|nr:hypothetical protein [Bacteroidia bacterium]
MTSVAIKKQLNNYIPLLTNKQQALLLEMVKNILQVDNSEQRISLKQYNKEIAEAEKQIASGKFISQSDLEKESATW